MSDQQDSRTFSDAWHRVGQVRVSLRSSVQAQRQWYQGQRWVILRDRLSSDWFRVHVDAYDFVCRLNPQVTVDEVWQDTRVHDPERCLTQEEVVQLLGQLNLSNLLQVDRATAGERLFARYDERIKGERKAFWMGLLAIRIPLLDPNAMLDRALPMIRALLSPVGISAYLLLLLAAAVALVQNADQLLSQTAGVLAPGNLALLYVGFVVAKVVHEFGHAAVCKSYGGEVHVMGVMLLIFAPLPYVDASASWGFRLRRQRIFVSLSGVLAELAVAAVAALIWANTAPGTLNALAHNVIFAASISSVLFNLNPLLRFDGYHVLVDVLGMPNLFQRSRQQLQFLLQRFLLGVKHAQAAALNRREVLVLPLYGLISLGYWVLLMSGIVFFIATQYLDLGLALAWFLVFVSLVMPAFKALRYLSVNPQLHGQRLRAWLITLSLCGVVVGGLAAYPASDRTRIQGVIQASEFRAVHTEAAGQVVALEAQPGQRVRAGQVLLRLQNQELELEMKANQAALTQVEVKIWRALTKAVGQVPALEKQRLAILAKGQDLRSQAQALVVKAPLSGVWAVSESEVAVGRWLDRGGVMGQVVDPARWQFVGVLPQVDTYVFEDQIDQAQIKLIGQEDLILDVSNTQVLQHENAVLPSVALGMAGGGELAIDPTDPNGTKALEPFFRVNADLPDQQAQAMLLHGRVAVMRLTFASKPLMVQWERGIRQFFQRRFRV